MVFRSQAGLIGINGEVKPVRCVDEPGHLRLHQPDHPEVPPATAAMNNRNSHTRDDAYSLQFINRLEFFLNSKALGEHHVQIKDNLITQTDTFRRSMPGDHVIELNGPVPDARVDYYSNDPRLEPARYGWFITSTRSIRNTLSLTDTWRPSRHFTVTPGLAYTNATAGNQLTPTVMKGNCPVAQPVAGLGRHPRRPHGGAHQREPVRRRRRQLHRQPHPGHPGHPALPLERDQRRVRPGLRVSAAASTTAPSGLPCGPTGFDATGQSCRRKLVLPKTWEYTAGVEREVMQGVAMGLDVIYRKFNNQYEKFETNRIWNKAGSRLEPTGAYRNGRATTGLRPGDARRGPAPLRGPDRLDEQARGADEAAGVVYLEPAGRHRARGLLQPPGRHLAPGTSS